MTWRGLVVVALVIPALFWLKLGTIDGYGIAFTAFIVMLLGAVAYSSKVAEELPVGAGGQPPPITPGPFDKLGVVWLLSIPFAPLFTWMVAGLWTLDSSNWRLALGLRAVLCVALPVLCSLPLLKYARGNRARPALVILFVGTAFPVACGWTALVDLIRGPVSETVEITHLERIHFTRHFHDVATDVVTATLADGRELTSNSEVVQLSRGPARISLLKSNATILQSQPVGTRAP